MNLYEDRPSRYLGPPNPYDGLPYGYPTVVPQDATSARSAAAERERWWLFIPLTTSTIVIIMTAALEGFFLPRPAPSMEPVSVTYQQSPQIGTLDGLFPSVEGTDSP